MEETGGSGKRVQKKNPGDGARTQGEEVKRK